MESRFLQPAIAEQIERLPSDEERKHFSEQLKNNEYNPSEGIKKTGLQIMRSLRAAMNSPGEKCIQSIKSTIAHWRTQTSQMARQMNGIALKHDEKNLLTHSDTQPQPNYGMITSTMDGVIIVMHRLLAIQEALQSDTQHPEGIDRLLLLSQMDVPRNKTEYYPEIHGPDDLTAFRKLAIDVHNQVKGTSPYLEEIE